MEDFDRTPFVDPFFAAVAAQHGHGPEHLVLGSAGSTPFFGDKTPAGMPAYDYRTASAFGEAHLCLYMKDAQSSFNYARSSDGARILFFRDAPSQQERRSLEGSPLSTLVDCAGAEGYVITGFGPVAGHDGFQVLVEHPMTRPRHADTPLEDIDPSKTIRCLPVAGRTTAELGAIARDRSARTGASVLIVSLDSDETTLASTGWLTNTVPAGGLESASGNGVLMVEGPPMHDWLIDMVVGGIRADAQRLGAKAVLYQCGQITFAIDAESFGPA